MAEASESVRADIKRYQDVVERLRMIAINRQQIQARLNEVSDALKELNSLQDDAPVYKIVGSIIVRRKKEDIVKELNNTKELLEVRLKTLEKQEELLKKQLNELERKLVRKLGGRQAEAG